MVCPSTGVSGLSFYYGVGGANKFLCDMHKNSSMIPLQERSGIFPESQGTPQNPQCSGNTLSPQKAPCFIAVKCSFPWQLVCFDIHVMYGQWEG